MMNDVSRVDNTIARCLTSHNRKQVFKHPDHNHLVSGGGWVLMQCFAMVRSALMTLYEAIVNFQLLLKEQHKSSTICNNKNICYSILKIEQQGGLVVKTPASHLEG